MTLRGFNEFTCFGGFTVSGNIETDISRAKAELNRMRDEVKQIPEDPFLVMPKNSGSSDEVKSGNILP